MSADKITTLAELDALPVGTVVIDSIGLPALREQVASSGGSLWFQPGNHVGYPSEVYASMLPLRVLHQPGEGAAR